MDGALRHQPPHLLGHLLGRAVHLPTATNLVKTKKTKRITLLVESHFLLAAEALAAGVAEVEAGHVAPLVNHQVVRF